MLTLFERLFNDFLLITFIVLTSLTSLPELFALFPDYVVSFPGFVDFIRILLTCLAKGIDFVLESLTPHGAAQAMKNTQGVPCGRGQTAPESPLGFHICRCGPSSLWTSDGVFRPML